ncbi:MAG: asparagine synthase (glutamine-hydrolyzing) [Myxococcales bacterium]|nr:asparagine synthase (glutamine-hydrolyzing) [Myxococcales bacterium]
MCGIVGIYCFDKRRGVDREVFVRQVDALAHRGPDDGGAYFEPGVALGHRRLSIIDLGGGHQPMWDSEGRLGIVFNGEIYNYRELKKELEQEGHRFRTDSDTEVILNAYRQWGARCVDHFVGMFAFCVFDRQERTFFLARDRLGKKPLYFYKDDERLIFASELKAILMDPTVPRVMEPTAVVDYFAYNYVPGPQSILRDVQKLPAGHAMLVSPDRVVMQRYWDVDFSHVDRTKNLEQNATALIAHLEDAVRLRLRSDVPLGAFLSGGVDSSLVVALMARQLHEPVKTHTIGFDEAEYDERAYARETAALYETEHHEKIVSVDAAGIIDQLSWFYDEPFGDSSAVPTYYLSQATREKVTVALSGDGGDENFAGYRRYQFAMAEDRVRTHVPHFIRKNLIKPVADIYPKADFLPRYLRAKATLTNLAESHERAYFLSLTQKTYPRLLSPTFLTGVSEHDPFEHFQRHLAQCGTEDRLARLQYVDLKLYLCDDILVKVDRASMAHALEVRVPILDHHIVDRAARLPAKYKLDGQQTKVALKYAARRMLPRQILERKKMGFTIPLPEWFRGGLRARAEAAFFGQKGGYSGLLDTAGLRRMWYEHQLGISNHATVLWSTLMFEEWARRFMSGGDLAAGAVLPRGARPTRIQTEALPALRA